jgi:hypothetical protein
MLSVNPCTRTGCLNALGNMCPTRHSRMQWAAGVHQVVSSAEKPMAHGSCTRIHVGMRGRLASSVHACAGQTIAPAAIVPWRACPLGVDRIGQLQGALRWWLDEEWHRMSASLPAARSAYCKSHAMGPTPSVHVRSEYKEKSHGLAWPAGRHADATRAQTSTTSTWTWPWTWTWTWTWTWSWTWTWTWTWTCLRQVGGHSMSGRGHE